MAKYVLNSAPGELDFVLFGIVCPDNQYRAVSVLQDALRTEFALSDYVPFNMRQERLFRFSLFHAADEELMLEYYFVPNLSNFEEPGRTEQGPGLFSEVEIDERVRLIRELPSTDYFLIVKGEQAAAYSQRISDALGTVADFRRIQSIEPAELQSGRNLIF